MRPPVLAGAAVAAALLLPLQAAEAPPQDAAQAVDELQDVLRTLRDERAAAYGRRRARAAEIESARSPLRRLEGDLAELKAKEAEADRALAELRRELGELGAAAAADQAAENALAPELEASAAFFRELVDQGLPYRQDERRARLGGPGPVPDRLGRAWTFAQEELRIARSGEAWSADVPLPGGRAKPARIFRTGHLLAGFVTEDGAESGLWSAGAWTPREDPAIRRAVDMIDRRLPPGLLRLPVERRDVK
jgi:hypothetical protein